MGNFEGGFPRQDHHRRGKVYLSSTTPNLIFLIVLANRPVVYEAERCQTENAMFQLDLIARRKLPRELALEAGLMPGVGGLTTRVMHPRTQQRRVARW